MVLDRASASFKIFDRIAKRYDFLNGFLSLGIDRVWRRILISKVKPGKTLLDVATGTGDLVLALAKRFPKTHMVGLDLSKEMLKRAEQKKKINMDLVFCHGDAQNLPFSDASFDTVTIAFGIRNVPNARLGLKEMLRVLKPGGQLLILEFSLPNSRLLRRLYLFYFRHILPRIGAFFSGDSEAYRYLNETVEQFPYGHAFRNMMTEAGCIYTHFTPLTVGICTLYEGFKAEPDQVS